MSDWKPIFSAPRDGSRFIAANDQDLMIVNWPEGCALGKWTQSKTKKSRGRGKVEWVGSIIVPSTGEFTHWRPISDMELPTPLTLAERAWNAFGESGSYREGLASFLRVIANEVVPLRKSCCYRDPREAAVHSFNNLTHHELMGIAALVEKPFPDGFPIEVGTSEP